MRQTGDQQTPCTLWAAMMWASSSLIMWVWALHTIASALFNLTFAWVPPQACHSRGWAWVSTPQLWQGTGGWLSLQISARWTLQYSPAVCYLTNLQPGAAII